ncbi:hypothetical protein A2U01_0101037, partial [Trifolium medium]|nr:hypothetical protein [Trifolium medium]
DTVHALLFSDITVHARTVHRHYCSPSVVLFI